MRISAVVFKVLKDEQMDWQIIETTVGRVIFNEVVPAQVGFINLLLTKKAIGKVIGEIIKTTDVLPLPSSWMISRISDSVGHSAEVCHSISVTW